MARLRILSFSKSRPFLVRFTLIGMTRNVRISTLLLQKLFQPLFCWMELILEKQHWLFANMVCPSSRFDMSRRERSCPCCPPSSPRTWRYASFVFFDGNNSSGDSSTLLSDSALSTFKAAGINFVTKEDLAKKRDGLFWSSLLLYCLRWTWHPGWINDEESIGVSSWCSWCSIIWRWEEEGCWRFCCFACCVMT